MKTLLAIMLIFTAFTSHAMQSTIVDAEGYACMGDDKSRRQTEQAAMTDAKRKASESALTYLIAESRTNNFQLEKDVIEAYTRAAVRVVQELDKGWYRDVASGDCYTVKIKAEITPDEKLIERVSKTGDVMDNPSAPLKVRLWTDKSEYRYGDRIKVYLKGNKPFYACILYRDINGQLLQLLPNPYRKDNYFNGGIVYELPSGNDRFELVIQPPFGQEDIIIYASTSQLGNLNLESMSGAYRVKTRPDDVGIITRAVQIDPRVTGGRKESAAEFSEEKVSVQTKAGR